MISLDSMISEAIRELGYRRRFYDRLCAEGRMNRRLANFRIDAMQAILERLMKDREAEELQLTSGDQNARQDDGARTSSEADRRR
jgi:hypothetical protein